MLAVVACEEIGGLSGFGGSPGDFASDAVDMRNGGRLVTAPAGQLASRESIRRT